MPSAAPAQTALIPRTGLAAARRKFLSFFPGGFDDETYLATERGYKWRAHLEWREALGPATLADLLRRRCFGEIAARAVRIEARTNLLFSFEKMALRDAVKGAGAEPFARGLAALLAASRASGPHFDAWVETLAALPRRQTRVLTWPLATVFGFIAKPKTHFFVKPMVMRAAARALGADFGYVSRPNARTYAEALALARTVGRELAALGPKDMIDAQGFLWVQGSGEYGE